MAFPKDLRQRMINLMYLVLMAMLAINIDPAALQGYKTINNGMSASYNAFAVKNDATVKAIAAKAEEEGKEDQLQYAELATRVNGVSNSMDDKINSVIAQIRDEATVNGKYSADSKDPADKIMIGQDFKTGEAAAVRTKIEEVIAQYTALVNESPLEDSLKQQITSNFALQSPSDEVAIADPDNKDKKGWELFTFKGKPAIALEAILNQMKNDAKATEGQILEEFAKKLDADKIDFPIDTYNLAVIPSSTYVESGDKFTAKINVGQSSSKAQNLVKIYADGRLLPLDNNGFATYTAPSKSVGDYSFKNAYAEITNPQTGAVTRVDLEDAVNYKVINAPDKPSAAVSADKMNVLYVGLDNPVSVSASGELGGVTASCSGCASFNKNGTGGYDAKVTAASVGNPVKISVAINGQNIDSKEFRVLKVPDPDVKVGNFKPGRSISTSSLAAQKILRADLDNFPYDAAFKVVSFDFGMLKGNATPFSAKSNGPRLTPQMSNAIQRAGAGWFVVFRNIKVQGPDGEVRDVGSITYITK